MDRMKMLVAVMVAGALVGATAPAAEAQQKVSLVFSAGPTGGTWSPMAAATAEVIKRKYTELDVQVEPGAALVNMEKMRNDKADIAWSMSTVTADVRAGVNSWKGKQTEKPLFVANFYPNVWQVVVPLDAPIRLAVVMAAIWLAASPGELQTGTPKKGGVLRVGMIGEPPTLDQHATTAVITREVGINMFEGLFALMRSTSRRPCSRKATRSSTGPGATRSA